MARRRTIVPERQRQPVEPAPTVAPEPAPKPVPLKPKPKPEPPKVVEVKAPEPTRPEPTVENKGKAVVYGTVCPYCHKRLKTVQGCKIHMRHCTGVPLHDS